ncbi:hypothetical protein [Vulcanococcus sp.]|uniref:hypothetical protein n=1 Tax=Vulcanococcus sp. TaxID=2856995 RepID=UPI003C09EC6D
MSQQPPVTRLPFKSAPRVETTVIGNERTGTLEFPVYNDLTVSESSWMASQMAESNTFSYTSRLALKISKLENCKPVDAHTFVAKVLAKAMGANAELTDEEEGWTIKYVKELEQTALKVVDVSMMQQNLLVTAVIRHRLPGMSDWTISDTETLPNDLVQGVYVFAMAEKNHGHVQTIEEVNRELELQLGKLKPAPTKSQKSRTGRKSSTGANTSTQETQISPTTDLDPSLAPTP